MSELCHAGIKGQRWGRRRYRNYDGTLTSEGKERYRYNDSDSDSEGKRVTNEELQQLITRLRLEKEYKMLVRDLQPPKKSTADKIMNFTRTAGNVVDFTSKIVDFIKKFDSGNKPQSPYDTLKKEVDMLELKRKKDVLRKYFEKEKSK